MESELKITLLNILNRCVYNKPIADFNAIIKLINSINDDSVNNINIKFNDTGIYISMFNSDYKLISISFTDSNKLLFCLPDNVSQTYVIENCSYNIQYNEIKALLDSK